jgi:cysteine desulfurase / selenocysteine lyase
VTDASRDGLARFRAEMPITEHWVYLNHAGIGPLTRTGVERMDDLNRVVAESGDRRWPARGAEGERVRGATARLLGAREPHEVAFVGNTSEALSAVAWGLDWRPDDNVVGPEPEFPSNVYPWTSLAPLGVEYRRVPERPGEDRGRIEPADLLAAMDGRTRVVALSWIQYATGHRIDRAGLTALAAACRDAGALLVVDAIQGAGVLRLDVEAAGVDVCALACHKWLLSPEGVGVLYVSDRVVERLRSTRHGWRSVAGRFDWTTVDPTPAEGALRFEAGTLNLLGMHAVGATLDLFEELGAEWIEERVLALAARVARGLGELGFELAEPRRAPGETSGIVAAVHPERPAKALADALAAQGIAAAERAGRLRISPHAYTTEDEIDRMLAALAALV